MLLKLNKVTSIGAKLYKHYLDYPNTWDVQRFDKWRKKSEQLFGKTM